MFLGAIDSIDDFDCVLFEGEPAEADLREEESIVFYLFLRFEFKNTKAKSVPKCEIECFVARKNRFDTRKLKKTEEKAAFVEIFS